MTCGSREPRWVRYIVSEQRVAVVTGVAGGLGAAISAALAGEGWRVVGTDVVEPEELAADVEFLTADITSAKSVAAVYATVDQRFGRLDGLVNNASVYRTLGPKGAFGDVPVGEFDMVLRVNVRGTWQMMAGAIDLLRRSGGGSIVNISSGTSRAGVVGFPHYVASKSAVEGLTRVGARELGSSGIRVNAVAPGLVSTVATRERVPQEALSAVTRMRSIPRDISSEDIVGAVAFLLGNGAKLISGQTLLVDGGDHFV